MKISFRNHRETIKLTAVSLELVFLASLCEMALRPHILHGSQSVWSGYTQLGGLVTLSLVRIHAAWWSGYTSSGQDTHSLVVWLHLVWSGYTQLGGLVTLRLVKIQAAWWSGYTKLGQDTHSLVVWLHCVWSKYTQLGGLVTLSLVRIHEAL